jgi:hypothetical protein
VLLLNQQMALAVGKPGNLDFERLSHSAIPPGQFGVGANDVFDRCRRLRAVKTWFLVCGRCRSTASGSSEDFYTHQKTRARPRNPRMDPAARPSPDRRMASAA